MDSDDCPTVRPQAETVSASAPTTTTILSTSIPSAATSFDPAQPAQLAKPAPENLASPFLPFPAPAPGPSGLAAFIKFPTSNPSTSSTKLTKPLKTSAPPIPPAQPLKTTVVNNPHTETLARGVISRLGRFLVGKCAGKETPKEAGGAEEEYALADDLRRPDDTSKSLVTKFDKKIKAKVTEMGFPTPTKLIFIGYKTHQVSGKDYFLKLKAANSGQYFHIRIYESLQADLILQDVAGPKFNSDPVEIPE